MSKITHGSVAQSMKGEYEGYIAHYTGIIKYKPDESPVVVEDFQHDINLKKIILARLEGSGHDSSPFINGVLKCLKLLLADEIKLPKFPKTYEKF